MSDLFKALKANQEKQESPVLNDEQSAKLAAYSKYLDTPKQMPSIMEAGLKDNPINEGLMQGGFMGGVANVGKAAALKAAPAAAEGFSKLRGMLGEAAGPAAGEAMDALKSSVKLDASHPAMQGLKDQMRELEKQGIQYFDPAMQKLQQLYNRKLR